MCIWLLKPETCLPPLWCRLTLHMLIAASKDNACDMVCQVVELTDVARQFLDARFSDFDRDKDGVLSQAELDEIYSTSPSRSAACHLGISSWQHPPPSYPDAAIDSVTAALCLSVMHPLASHLPEVPVGEGGVCSIGLQIDTVAQPRLDLFMRCSRLWGIKGQERVMLHGCSPGSPGRQACLLQ